MLSILDVVCGNLGGVPRSILSFDARKRNEVKDLWVRRGGYAPPRGDWNSGSYYEEEEEFVDDRGYYGYDYEQKPKVSVHLTQLIHRISWILISRLLPPMFRGKPPLELGGHPWRAASWMRKCLLSSNVSVPFSIRLRVMA